MNEENVLNPLKVDFYWERWERSGSGDENEALSDPGLSQEKKIQALMSSHFMLSTKSQPFQAKSHACIFLNLRLKKKKKEKQKLIPLQMASHL